LVHRLYNSCDIGGQNFATVRPLAEVSTSLLDEKGYCLAATLLSEAIFIQENQNFWDKMPVESIFKNLPIHPCSLAVVMVDRNTVCFGNHEHFFFLLAFPIMVSFSS
jgi:hypothetical protein